MRDSALPWVVGSLALHMLAGLLVRAPVLAARRGAAGGLFTPIELEIEVLAPRGKAPKPLEAAVAPAASSEPALRPSGARPRGVRPRGESHSGAAGVARAGEPANSGDAAEAAEPPKREAPRVDPAKLSPLTAAWSVLAGQPSEVAEAPSPSQVLNEAIAKGAERKRDVIPDPVLKPRPEGGYVYRGNGFDAVIEPDGQVTMDDHYGHASIVPTFEQREDGNGRIVFFHGSFRLYEWLDRKFGKNDPYQSERRWFLERTRELRERLEREYVPRSLSRE